uniref:Zn(2)-C6 fungal-type domain-containing protein n=1 Tax=Moniliophthora roreri TaxID=221103 RepID=A0A0W0FEY6_MONRR
MTSRSSGKHSRVLVACNNCRSRKVKCNRSNPHNPTSACERCLSKRLRCEYTTMEADVSSSGVDMSPVYLYPADHYNYNNPTSSQVTPAMSTGLPAMPGPGHQLQSNISRQTGGVHAYQNYPSDTRYPVRSAAYTDAKSSWPPGMPAQYQSSYQGGGTQSSAHQYRNSQSNTNPAYAPPSQSRFVYFPRSPENECGSLAS